MFTSSFLGGFMQSAVRRLWRAAAFATLVVPMATSPLSSATASHYSSTFETASNSVALPSARTTYRRLPDYQNELEALADDNPRLVKIIPPVHDPRGTKPLGRRDHHETESARWQARLSLARRPPGAIVAGGGARDGVGIGARRRIQGQGPAHPGPRRFYPNDRDTGRQPRCVQRVAGSRPNTGGRSRPYRQRGHQPGDAPARVQAEELQRRGKLCNAVRPGGARCRPEPELWTLLGGSRRGHEPNCSELPRHRPLLGAGVPQHPRSHLEPACNHPHLELHLLGSRLAASGRSEPRSYG